MSHVQSGSNDINQVRHGCEKKLTEQFSDYNEFICKRCHFCPLHLYILPVLEVNYNCCLKVTLNGLTELILLESLQTKTNQGKQKKRSLNYIRKLIQFCSGTGTENQCFNITYANIPEHSATFADVCFCNEDK